MATGRLASGSIAAGGATQLYRNSTGNPQVITLLASSQVSGKAPKLNVKITSENFTVPSTSTQVVSGTNHTLDTSYPSQAAQFVAGTFDGTDSTLGSPAVTDAGSRLHLSIGEKNTKLSMGQAWSKGYEATTSGTKDYAWGKASFGGQPMSHGGDTSSSYDHHDNSNSYCRTHMPVYPPYYFENPNAFNQNKARGIVCGNDGNDMYHIEDISKMEPQTLMKYYNTDYGAGGDLWSYTAPSTNSATYGTVTTRSTPQNYANRGWIYDIYTGLFWGWQSSGYNSYMWFDEANPSEVDPSGSGTNNGDSTSNGGVWRWSQGSWTGSDPKNYRTDGRGSPYGCEADCENGLIVTTSGTYSDRQGFKYYDKYFDDMMDKDTRASNQNLETFSRSSYYHTVEYQGSNRYLRLQWVSYHPGNNKYYVCFWDPSGTYNATGGATIGTSYTSEAGIFEVDVSKIYGKDQSIGNTAHESMAHQISAGMLTKVGSVPDTTSGLMSKPMRIKDSLWTAHCQDGKMYFSTNLYTWAEQDSDTHFSTDYAMVNASKLGLSGTTETNYFVAADSTSVVYSYSTTVSADVYDQAAVAGIIAKGAVTPYEQKAIILSDGDAIYVENEDATNAISITAMGVDV